MKVGADFTYAGKEYHSGDDFDEDLLDAEDRNDIFMNRIRGTTMAQSEDLPDQPAKEAVKKGSKK